MTNILSRCVHVYLWLADHFICPLHTRCNAVGKYPSIWPDWPDGRIHISTMQAVIFACHLSVVEDGLLKPKRERRSRERSHRSRSRDRKRSRRSRSRERRGGSKSRDRRRGGAATNGEVSVKQEVEDPAGEYEGSAGAENNYYNEHAGIDPANY